MSNDNGEMFLLSTAPFPTALFELEYCPPSHWATCLEFLNRWNLPPTDPHHQSFTDPSRLLYAQSFNLFSSPLSGRLISNPATLSIFQVSIFCLHTAAANADCRRETVVIFRRSVVALRLKPISGMPFLFTCYPLTDGSNILSTGESRKERFALLLGDSFTFGYRLPVGMAGSSHE